MNININYKYLTEAVIQLTIQTESLQLLNRVRFLYVVHFSYCVTIPSVRVGGY